MDIDDKSSLSTTLPGVQNRSGEKESRLCHKMEKESHRLHRLHTNSVSHSRHFLIATILRFLRHDTKDNISAAKLEAQKLKINNDMERSRRILVNGPHVITQPKRRADELPLLSPARASWGKKKSSQ